MKYMLLICHDEQSWTNRTETERQSIYAEYRLLIEELKSQGKYLFGDQLQAANTAQCVRVRKVARLFLQTCAKDIKRLGMFALAHI